MKLIFPKKKEFMSVRVTLSLDVKPKNASLSFLQISIVKSLEEEKNAIKSDVFVKLVSSSDIFAKCHCE
jgi:hypothetical protein